MTGREKCEMLRQLRAEVARDYKIPLKQEPCNHPGDDCSGTCGLCEQELRYLLEEIEKKERAGYTADLEFWEKEALKFKSELIPFPEDPMDPDDLTLDTLYEDDLRGAVEYIGTDVDF